MLALAVRLIDRFQPPPVAARPVLLQRRFLVGASLIGLAVSLLSVASEAARGQWANTVVIGAFGACLLALLRGNAAGVSMALLGRACLVLLSVFFTGAALVTVEIQHGQLKWLALLPLVALLLDSPPRGLTASGRGRSLLGATTVAAVLLGGFVVFAHQAGWTLGMHDTQTAAEHDAEQLVDFALFTCSVAGLVWVHRLATRRTDEELAMLRSMLSVCAWCKRIHSREDERWIALDDYMARHGATRLTHGICPDCAGQIEKDMQPHD
jgi:hypothetical protein